MMKSDAEGTATNEEDINCWECVEVGLPDEEVGVGFQEEDDDDDGFGGGGGGGSGEGLGSTIKPQNCDDL